MTVKMRPSVLIIGCGPAGLGAIEQFKRKGFDVVAYEARDSVGGLWNFDPTPPPCRISFDEAGHAVALTDLERSGKPAPAPTPIYAGVTANTPRDIMPYRSHPYAQGTAESPTYDVIYRYQQNHAATYASHIKLNRVVTRVRHTPPDRASSKRWLIEWSPSATSKSPDVGKIFEEEFDNIVVANGSDSRPFIPWIDNLWAWKGEILHSRWYRQAKAFAGKTVMVMGAGPSSADLVREFGMLCVEESPLAPRRVYRSLRSKPRYDTEREKGWTEYIKNVAPIRTVEPPSLDSGTGRIITVSEEILDDVDVIVFATGFLFRFEFCLPSDSPFDKAPLLRDPYVPQEHRRPPKNLVGQATLEGGHRVHHLDAHQIFYLPDPTLAFLLLHAEAIPWPFSEMQARAIAAYWSGTPLELTPHLEEESDSHSTLILGHPGEFEYAERLLSLIGEGGPEEVDAEERWGAWPAWKQHIRELID
ncbi:formyltetrahydrofolate deformylase [Eremomyces bilateralis CBS 781.70]|uniref:Formyltetrahydrofolate deformylase n=1 Tax=Eremomyces bilateralis CBS 781.70 TaxID=1392243 RepID=A0A6G1G8M0_9PEZI|nr:formyltetrahydrofolate deformylase [Eremomyces bilateralis CBS 781.70]KAF1814418.1 formyltetrahydrofolate deformylase [Eremomyces bilateralis CBS 781.70]